MRVFPRRIVNLMGATDELLGEKVAMQSVTQRETSRIGFVLGRSDRGMDLLIKGLRTPSGR